MEKSLGGERLATFAEHCSCRTRERRNRGHMFALVPATIKKIFMLFQ
jgi:hypothetical protein